MNLKTTRLLLITLLLSLAACTPAGLLLFETPTSPLPAASNTPPPTPLPLAASPTPPPVPRAERVLIISFDGLMPGAIGKAPMTNLISLMENSTYSLSAQTILPSYSQSDYH